jgi:cytochrome c
MPLQIDRLAVPLAMSFALMLAGCGSEPKPTESGPSAAAPEAPSAPAEEVKEAKFAALTGDAAKGKIVFAQCKSCHSLEAGKNMIGPSLHALIGRKAASEAGFAYSAGMTKSGLTWDEETLFHYLVSPMKDVPGTKMAFAGIKDAQKRADLVAYLKAPN